MPQRKAWTSDEDKALKEIVTSGVKKWTVVAAMMEKNYKIFGRTGKQCRQRWHNQLDPNINNADWSEEQQNTLYKLHNLMGNCWSKISLQLKGRTDNQVKNHFYSTIRKAFRRLNRHISDCKSQKQMKAIILTKLLSAAEDKFDKKLKLSPDIIEISIDLKNRLMKLAYAIEENKETIAEMNSIIQSLGDFTKSWKRKKKKGKKEAHDFEEEDDDSPEEIQSSIQQIKRIPTRQSERQKLVKKPSKQIHQSVKKQIKQSKPEPPVFERRRSSRIQSNTNQPQGTNFPIKKMSSLAFSLYDADDNQFPLMRKRSSSRSNFSSLGNNLFPRFSEYQMNRAGFNLTDSQNNIASNNLFQYPPEFIIQRLDD